MSENPISYLRMRGWMLWWVPKKKKQQMSFSECNWKNPPLCDSRVPTLDVVWLTGLNNPVIPGALCLKWSCCGDVELHLQLVFRDLHPFRVPSSLHSWHQADTTPQSITWVLSPPPNISLHLNNDLSWRTTFKRNVSCEMHARFLTAVALQIYSLAGPVCLCLCLCIWTKALQWLCIQF